MMVPTPKIGDAARDKLSPKEGLSAQADRELSVWDFIRAGVALDLIIAVVILGISQGRITADTIPVGFAVLVLVSIAIWGGLALVAVPTLIAQRIRRNWTHRRAKRRAGQPSTWDDWIDGPRPG